MCICLSWNVAAAAATVAGVLSQSTFKPINFGSPIAATQKMHAPFKWSRQFNGLQYDSIYIDRYYHRWWVLPLHNIQFYTPLDGIQLYLHGAMMWYFTEHLYDSHLQ